METYPSLFEVYKQFIGFFTKGATIAPDVIEFFCLAMTLATIYVLFICPILKLVRGK